MTESFLTESFLKKGMWEFFAEHKLFQIQMILSKMILSKFFRT